ncbi:unnamed protein product [Clonostachys chloroleuca]|uniref:Uncharacterized protein n=1 Tax=Clonostachys chloroleuca TaxID=1926264 RepID=A0AA35QBJ0_9HYPO|nr:unnamed protein product [Clonostachys chloroleuca]
MTSTFKPVIWNGEGHIVDIAFSEKLQTVFLGISDGTICLVSNNWQVDECRVSGSAVHDGGGLEHLRVITGDPEQLVSIASDGSVVVWNIISGGLQHVRTLHGFHSLTPPHIIACRRAGVNSPASALTARYASKFLVFATDDGALNWWDLENFSSNATYLDGLGLITALDIDIAEDLISVGTASGQVRVWRMSTLGYVFQTVVPGVVTKLAFLPEGTGEDGNEAPQCRRRQLALVTNETALQIRTFDSKSGRQMEAPRDVPEYLDANVFELYPMDSHTLFVVERDGAVRVLRRGEGNSESNYCLDSRWAWRRDISPPLNASLNASVLLVDKDSGSLFSFLSYSSQFPDGGCWASSSSYRPSSESARHPDSVGSGEHRIRNVRPVPYHLVHQAPLRMLFAAEEELQEKPFHLGAFASAHGLIHGDSETPDPGAQDLPSGDSNLNISDTDGTSFDGNSSYPGQSRNSDLDSDEQDTNLDTSVEDLNDDSRLHLRTVTLGHPASNFIPRLEDARQRHSPEAGEIPGDADHICHHQGPPLEGAALPHPRDVETTKLHARFLASLISGRIWNHDHLARFADAITDNERDRQDWLSKYNTHESLLEAEKKRLGGKAGRKALNDLSSEKLQQRVDARYKANAEQICETARKEKQADTVAVGISPDGKDIFIAGNVKNCETWVLRRGRGGATSTRFGLHDNRYNHVIWEVLRKWYPEATSPDVRVHILAPDVHPMTVNDMRKFHAETQIVAFAIQNDLLMPILGVSKPPCHRCDEALAKHGVEHGHNAIKDANVRVREDRWESDYAKTRVTATPSRPSPPESHDQVDQIELEPAPAASAPRISIKHQALGAAKNLAGAARKAYTTPRVTPPIKLTPKALAKATVVHPIHNRRPRVSGGVGAMIESVVDTWDRNPYADADTDYADTGVYETRMTRGVYAQAGYGVARAGYRVAEAEARGPNVSAGAQVGYLSGVSVFAHAELASAQASVAGVTGKVGLNANTGFSAGPEGVSASFLGFGGSIGPHMEVDTPVASVSCVVM